MSTPLTQRIILFGEFMTDFFFNMKFCFNGIKSNHIGQFKIYKSKLKLTLRPPFPPAHNCEFWNQISMQVYLLSQKVNNILIKLGWYCTIPDSMWFFHTVCDTHHDVQHRFECVVLHYLDYEYLSKWYNDNWTMRFWFIINFFS